MAAYFQNDSFDFNGKTEFTSMYKHRLVKLLSVAPNNSDNIKHNMITVCVFIKFNTSKKE